jgi:hypothetical protein
VRPLGGHKALDGKRLKPFREQAPQELQPDGIARGPGEDLERRAQLVGDVTKALGPFPGTGQRGLPLADRHGTEDGHVDERDVLVMGKCGHVLHGLRRCGGEVSEQGIGLHEAEAVLGHLAGHRPGHGRDDDIGFLQPWPEGFLGCGAEGCCGLARGVGEPHLADAVDGQAGYCERFGIDPADLAISNDTQNHQLLLGVQLTYNRQTMSRGQWSASDNSGPASLRGQGNPK